MEGLFENGFIDNRLGPRFTLGFGRLGGSIGEMFCRGCFFVDGSIGGAERQEATISE
jgi:hypothetical protein